MLRKQQEQEVTSAPPTLAWACSCSRDLRHRRAWAPPPGLGAIETTPCATSHHGHSNHMGSLHDRRLWEWLVGREFISSQQAERGLVAPTAGD